MNDELGRIWKEVHIVKINPQSKDSIFRYPSLSIVMEEIVRMRWKKFNDKITKISKEINLDSVTVCDIVMKLHSKNCELFCYRK
jgi:hypothetical protein